MSTPDKNLYSYNGPDDDCKLVDDSMHSFGVEHTPAAWSDTLKYSTGLTDFVHRVGDVFGGKEDCIDVNNRCRNVAVYAKGLWSGGKYVATIKGGSTGTRITGRIVAGGSEVDVDIGNWSDQSDQPTTGTVLCLTRTDGRPVTVRVLNGEKPAEDPDSGPYRYVFPHPDAWYHKAAVWFFMTFRRVFWK